MKNILITGCKGQLGSEINKIHKNYSNFDFIFTDVEQFDVSNIQQVLKFFKENKFDYLINASAYTAVDKAEKEKNLAYKVNASGVKNLAEACKKNNVKLIHISTDYVFDGMNYKPYTEIAPTNPKSVYGQTKLYGEIGIIQSKTEHIIIRTSWLYSSFGNNFVKTIIKLSNEKEEIAVVNDQVGTPTNAADLAELILNIIENTEKNNIFHSGMYHYSNEGVCSWYDFAKEIVEIKNLNCKIKPTSTKNFPTPAPRPYYSVMDKDKIRNRYKLEIPHWKDSLKKMLI